MRQFLRIKGSFVHKYVPVPALGSSNILVRNELSLHIGPLEENILRSNEGSALAKMLKNPELLTLAIKKTQQHGIIKTYRLAKAVLSTWHTLGALCYGTVVEVGAGVKGFKKGDRIVGAGWHHANYSDYVLLEKEMALVVDEEPRQALLNAYASKFISALAEHRIPKNKAIVIQGRHASAMFLADLLSQQGYERVSFSDNPPPHIDVYISVHDDLDAGILAGLEDQLDGTKFIAFNEKANPIVPERARDATFHRLFLSRRQLAYGEDAADERHLGMPGEKHGAIALDGDLAVLPFAKIGELYERRLLSNNPLTFIAHERKSMRRTYKYFDRTKPRKKLGVAIVGAGNIAKEIHLPLLLADERCFVKYVMTSSGRTAASVADHYKIPYATSSYERILKDPQIAVVIILSHHASHAEYIARAFKAGKHVFVEKPLALTEEQCRQIERAHDGRTVFSLGFNKTFSDLSRKLKAGLPSPRGPLFFTYRLQAPINRKKAWYYDLNVGGGRLIGEYGHLFDYACWLIGSEVKSMTVTPLRSKDPYLLKESNLVISMSFEDGSIASLTCSEDGNANATKERLEAICRNEVIEIEDWKKMRRNGKQSVFATDKGYAHHLDAFLCSVLGESRELVDLQRALAVTRLSIRANEMVRR